MTKTKMTFTPALMLSLILHGLLFSLFPHSNSLRDISKSLSFDQGRIIISSILTKEPLKKTISKPDLVKSKPAPKEQAKPLEKKQLEPTALVRSFENSIIKNTPPTYPRIARKRGWQGDVQLLININKKGEVSRVTVLETSAHQVLTQSAVKSAKSWLFTPSSDKLPYQVKKTIKYQLK